MEKYKNIRLSDNVLHDMIIIQMKGESISNLIMRLIENYYEGPYFYNYYFKMGGTDRDSYFYNIWIRVSRKDRSHEDHYSRHIEINRKLTNVVKITENALICLEALRNHPDETFDTTISVLIAANLASEAYSSGQQSHELTIPAKKTNVLNARWGVL
jgi:hypothetical protein